jgi:release factor glutamine methyltransferase
MYNTTLSLHSARTRLASAGIETAALDARLLLAHALGCTREALLLRDAPLTEAEMHRVEALLARRMAQEPMAYILGTRDFWKHRFAVGPGCLIPRPDSETLVEAVLPLREVLGLSPRLLDLGVGSGCLLFSLLTEWPDAQGVGVDASPQALAYAVQNREALGLTERAHLVQGSWAEAVSGPFDVIISNPPYIAEADRATLALDVVHHEPETALFAGPDGLDDYRILIPHAYARLRSGGVLAVEIGMGQEQAIAHIATEAGFDAPTLHPDLAGILRVMLWQK